MRCVLVTGAGGFVGSALVRELVRRGHKVTGCVRRVPAAPIAGVSYIEVDNTLEGPNLDAALRSSDAVVHLVARTHSSDLDDTRAADLYRHTNVQLTGAIADRCVRAGVRRLVFLSSAKVNGEETHGRPFRASDAPRPADLYGQTKLEAEQLLVARTTGTGLGLTIVRPPLVYGPGVKANFSRLIGLVARGVPLPFASVRNSRSMIGLGNLCDFLAVALAHPAADSKTFLVADSAPVSTPHLLRAIGRALGRPVRLVPVPVRLLKIAADLAGHQAEFRRLTGSLEVDASEASCELGWRPPRTVDQELADTVRAWHSQSGR